MIIRKAEQRDLSAITDIYNYEVLNGTATFDIKPKSTEERQQWFDLHNKENHPLIVSENEEGKICGYASLSPYREKEAYRSCVELSVYVAHDSSRQGIATALMSEIINLAKKDKNTHTIVSVITAGNEASKKLHERFGFDFCGTISEVGMKFGKYLSIDNYCLIVQSD